MVSATSQVANERSNDVIVNDTVKVAMRVVPSRVWRRPSITGVALVKRPYWVGGIRSTGSRSCRPESANLARSCKRGVLPSAPINVLPARHAPARHLLDTGVHNTVHVAGQ